MEVPETAMTIRRRTVVKEALTARLRQGILDVMSSRPTDYHPSGRQLAATLAVPLALIFFASLGYFTHNFALSLLLVLACVVSAVVSGAVVFGAVFAVAYRPGATNRRPPNIQADLAALDALEPLRADRPEDRP